MGTLINGGRARDSANLANTPQQLDLTAAANTSPPESLANSPAQAPAPQTVPSPPRLWRWALLVADLFLVTLALLLVFKSPAPLKPWELALCALAVGLGALLACTALLGGRRQ